MNGKSVKIFDKKIGFKEPCFILSEIGNNHGGDPAVAEEMIKVSAECGCSGVKFQTFKGTDIISPIETVDAYPEWDISDRYKYWYQFLDSIALPYESYPELINYAHDLGLAFISTPTSIETAEFLNKVDVDAIKIASMDLTNLPMIKKISEFRKPVILSTGMGTIDEIKEAISWLGDVPLILLHCISNYPLESKDANLLNVVGLIEHFKIPTGFSDHSLGIELDISAVALGAVLIEKHFTLNRNTSEKIEHHFSLEPSEMKELVYTIRNIEKALGTKNRKIGSAEKKNAERFRRSLMLNKNMKAEEKITEKDVVWLRPGTGIKPKHYKEIVGKHLNKDKPAYEPLQWDDFQ